MEMIGKAAFTAISELMDSPPPSERSLVEKPAIRAPTTVEECRALKAWADAQSSVVPAATTSELARHLEYLAATLPRQATDELSGQKRTAVYVRILGGYSNDALAYMSRRACETLDWFPTTRKCLELLSEYRAPTSEKDRALMLCHHFWQGRFEDFTAALKSGDATQEMVDDVPERWRRIAMEQGFLRYMPEEDRYVIRRPKVDADAAQ